jgi:hypothetical protein
MYLALAAEILLFGYALFAYLRERSTIRAFVLHANDGERLRQHAGRLPGPFRGPALQFAGDLQRKTPLDEILCQAMIKTANATFGMAPAARVLLALALASLLFAPIAAALIEAASAVVRMRLELPSIRGPAGFPLARDAIDPAFHHLYAAFRSCVVLMIGAILVAGAHWLLNRSEVREARFIQALVEAAMLARPGAAAPVSGRLTELIAPDRRLIAPIAAFAFFILSAGAGWVVLYLTAGVKTANALGVFEVWPNVDRREPVAPAPGMILPTLSGGGSPIYPIARPPPTLTVGPEKIAIGNTIELGILDHDHLPPDWKTKIIGIKNLESFKDKNQLEITVAADRAVSMSAILELLEYLRANCALTRAYLVLRRNLVRMHRSAVATQAVIELDLARRTDVEPKLARLSIEPSTLLVSTAVEPSKSIKTIDPSWRRQLWRTIQAATAKSPRDARASWIAVSLEDRDVTYEKFLEILTTVDDTCAEVVDCGVPGRGLKFQLVESEAD